MLHIHLQNAMQCLRNGQPIMGRTCLKCALAYANRENDNAAKAFIMRALNYSRRIPSQDYVA